MVSSAAASVLGIATVRRRLDLASLLPVACPAAVLGVGLAAIAQNLVVPDTWVALVSGREVAQHGLPSTEQLTVLGQGEKWVDQQWLAQLVLYAAARLGGVGLVVAVCLAAAVAGFAIAALAAHHRGGSPLAILGFFAAAFAAAPSGVQARTQVLAIPLFSLTLWLLLRDRDGERPSTLWALPILCVWANLHGSVLLGAAIVGAYGAQILLKKRGWHWRAATLAVGGPAAVFASPYALDLPHYYRVVLFDPPYGREIVEWQRTTPSAHTAVFFLLAVVVATLLVVRRSRVTMFEYLVVGATFVTALAAVRGIAWFALAALAVMPPLATRRVGGWRFSGAPAMTMTAIAVVGVIAAVGWTSTRSYEASSEEGLTLIRQQPPSDLVFADLTLADWLLWEVPALRGRLAYDGRPDLFSRDEFAGVVRVARQEPGWQAVVHDYALVVTPPALAERMVATRRWERVFADATLTIIRRPTSA